MNYFCFNFFYIFQLETIIFIFYKKYYLTIFLGINFKFEIHICNKNHNFQSIFWIYNFYIMINQIVIFIFNLVVFLILLIKI